MKRLMHSLQKQKPSMFPCLFVIISCLLIHRYCRQILILVFVHTKGELATPLKEWRPLAEKGDARAQYHLGLMYENGEGVPQDDEKAVTPITPLNLA